MNTLERVRSRWLDAMKTGPAKGRGVSLDRLQGGSSGVVMYSATSTTNTTSDFVGEWRSVDNWLRTDLRPARARSRQLEIGNPWAQSFKSSLVNNTLGAGGFRFRANVVTSRAYGDNSDGVPDTLANTLIQDCRKNFEKAKNFTTQKKLTRRDADKMLLQRLAFDGEFILRRVKGFENDFKFSWQVIDPDFLDESLNRTEENGNFTKMGIEFDRVWKFPVAYYFLTRRPNDYIFDPLASQDRWIRVPAEDVIHVFIQEYPDQSRGIPWLFAAMINLKMIGAYEEAALINARIGASKMGFFRKTTPQGFEGDPTKLDDKGRIVDSAEPGTWTELPWNVEPVEWSPNYPDKEFGDFNKAMLRSISAGLKMSYMSLSNDLSEANFSSLRAGLNEEREQWMQIQAFLIERWKEPEFDEWIYRAMLSGQLRLPMGKIDKFNSPKFTGRRWPFVNPLQDFQAKNLALDMRVTSITAVIEEAGGDRDEVFDQIERDEKELQRRGIQRIHSTFQVVDLEAEDGNAKPGDGKKKKLPAPEPVPAAK